MGSGGLSAPLFFFSLSAFVGSVSAVAPDASPPGSLGAKAPGDPLGHFLDLQSLAI